jgi:hypothetical protein
MASRAICSGFRLGDMKIRLRRARDQQEARAATDGQEKAPGARGAAGARGISDETAPPFRYARVQLRPS